MDSIRFYHPPRTMTAFSNKAARFRDPFAFVPTGRGSQHTKWDDALERVEVVEIVDLTGPDKGGPILEQQPAGDGSDRVQGNPNLKALKADRVKHDAKDDHHDHHNSDNDNSDNDNSDDDDLPPLSDLLHEWRRERSIERRPLSLTQCIMTERLLGGSGLDGGLGMADAGAKIASLKPGDSPEKLIVLNDDDGSHTTTSGSDHESLGPTHLGSSLGTPPSSCDSSGEMTVGGQHIDAAPADGVPSKINRKGGHEGSISMDKRAQRRPTAQQRPNRPFPVSKPATKACSYNTSEQVPPASAGNIYDIFAEYDRFFRRDQTRQASRGRQQRPSSSCLSQSPLGRSIASVDATMLPSSKAGEPSITRNNAACGRHRQYGRQVTPPWSSFLLEVAAEAVHNKDLIDSSALTSTKLYSEDLYSERNDHCEGLDDELDLGRAPSTSSQGSSALHHSPLSVKGHLRTSNIGRKQSSVWTGSQDIAHGIATRRDRHSDTDLVSPLLEEEQDQFASFGGNATLLDVGPSQQRSLRPRKRSRKSEQLIAYLGGTAPPALTPSSQASSSRENQSSHAGDTPPILDGKEICIGDYVFVRCEDDGEDAVHPPEIAKVERIYPNGRLGMLWAYHPVHPHVPKESEFGPYEILLSDHKDTVRVECLMGYVEVEENCKNCEHAPRWCWNKRYRAKQRKIISGNWTAKRRRVDV